MKEARLNQITRAVAALVVFGAAALLIWGRGGTGGNGGNGNTPAGMRATPPPPPPPLTAASVQSLPDAKLSETVVRRVEAKIGNDPIKELEVGKDLPAGPQTIHSTVLAEARVRNFGFMHAMESAPARLFQEASAGYRRLGAEKQAELMDAALKVHAQGEKQGPKTVEGQWDRLDDGFAALEKTGEAEKLRAKYIRAHPDQFTGAAAL